MKIAVTYENGQVFQHFGHTEQFKVYDVEDGKVTGTEILDTGESGHGALAGFLKENGVGTLICGGIGGGARTALAEAGIQLYGGVTGSADDAVSALLKGELGYDPDVQCNHHDHEHDHCCGHDHHHHHADEVFTSWGRETAHRYTEEELDFLLKALSETEGYGTILRSKGIIGMADGSWKQFDLVPEEYEVREGQPDYTGRICVIGTDLKEEELEKLFHI